MRKKVLKMSRKVKCIIFSICAILVINSLGILMPQKAYAAQTKEVAKFNVDGKRYYVKVLNYDYDNNQYISINDFAKALSDTDKAFETEWTSKDGETCLVLKPTSRYQVEENEYEEVNPEDNKVNLTRKRMYINIGGNDYSFYMIPDSSKNERDCYVNLGELALSINMDISWYNGEVYINSKGEFDFNKYNLLDSGIFNMADSCLVGDATTGDIFYSMNENEIVTIASTTKLMTYLVIKDAMAKGEITDHDTITFSKKASDISKTGDGVVRVEPGQTADIMDVISAMLICSSNECSLALAEHLCGSEADFVERMNKKAVALGLSEDVEFFNPHGLPSFHEDVLTVKLQNHLSANDMFKISAHILATYPEITDITSIKKTKLASLNNFEAINTNVLLYNVPGVVGLKTGTTNKAQSCLISAYETEDMKGNTHHIVTVVYGAENIQTQSYVSMVLMRYGIQKFNAAELGISPERGDSNEIPTDLEGMIGAVINTARRNSK